MEILTYFLGVAQHLSSILSSFLSSKRSSSRLMRPRCFRKVRKDEDSNVPGPISVGFSGIPNNGTPYPYYSHTTPTRIPKDMGIVWEAYHKGVPLLGVLGITLDNIRIFAENSMGAIATEVGVLSSISTTPNWPLKTQDSCRTSVPST